MKLQRLLLLCIPLMVCGCFKKVTIITSGPAGAVSSRDATFTFTSAGDSDVIVVGYVYSLDGADYVFTDETSVTLSNLSYSQHTFEVLVRVPSYKDDYFVSTAPAFRTWSVSPAEPPTPGGSDATFIRPPGLTPVNSMAVQLDGKILIGGSFQVNQVSPVRSGIARLESNGAIESLTTFNPGTGADDAIHTIAVQEDGRILIGGEFGSVNGQPRGRIARLEPDGTVESTVTFNPGSGAGGFSVYQVALQPDGKILIGGDFEEVNGQPRNGIARLLPDGMLESAETFNPGTVPGDKVFHIAVQADGKILVGGELSMDRENAGGPTESLIRLEPDGKRESDTTFQPDLASLGGIETMSLQDDGSVVLGVYPAHGISLVRLLPDGSREMAGTFNPTFAIRHIFRSGSL